MLSLYAADLQAGASQTFNAGSSELVLHVLAGRGTIVIGGRDFAVESGDGAHVRSGEALRLSAREDAGLRVLMVVCPSAELAVSNDGEEGSGNREFDHEYPRRVVSARRARREVTGDRNFQVLLGPKTGSEAVTQFIGSIPRSRAPEHYHQYEEVIGVLSGHGKIWFGGASAPVRPGSLIFLPREQPHCLECTVAGGLELVGMFYPAGSPAVSYATGEAE